MIDSYASEAVASSHEGYRVAGDYGMTGAFEAPAHAFGAPAHALGGQAAPAGGHPRRDERTEALLTGGRRNTAPSRTAFLRGHWRAVAFIAGVLAVALIILAATNGGGPSASWPASVARMRTQIATACRNPNVAAEPSQVNWACAPQSRQVLWIFALLTSVGNPGYVDPSTGRQGLEPITPAQGGDVAWSLNLHQPYDPLNPVQSLAVAARAINNIIGGATLTSASGQPSVQAGLESHAGNCQRYTGSPELTRRAGYPDLCARPITASGEQALVRDVFRQWWTSAPATTIANAAVLFAHASDAAPTTQVQKILRSLPGSGA